MDGNDVQNDGCIRQKSVEDTISDKHQTKIFNIQRKARWDSGKRFQPWDLSVKTTVALIFYDYKNENFKSYVDVSHEHKTPSKPSVCTFKMSSSLAFKFLKKASSIALTRR